MLYINIQELSRWQTGSEELFYKVPLPGFPRLQTCPACRESEGDPAKMSSNHVFRDCTALKSARSRLKIDKFIVSYEAIGHEDVSTLMAFLNGFDVYGVKIDDVAHRDRGKALIDLRKTWQSVWCNSRGGKEESWFVR